MAIQFMNHHVKVWSELCDTHTMSEYPLKNYLESIEIDSQRAQHIITELSQCTCCERHMKNRPTDIDMTHSSTDTPLHKTTEKGDTRCQCPCRHHIRTLCRLCKD